MLLKILKDAIIRRNKYFKMSVIKKNSGVF